MSKVIAYKIVRDRSYKGYEHSLEQLVSAAIVTGWQPLGQPFTEYSYVNHGGNSTICQAMVKYEQTETPKTQTTRKSRVSKFPYPATEGYKETE